MHGDFINDQIFLESIPQLEKIEFQGLQPKYKYVLMLRSVISTFFMFIIFILVVSLFLRWSYGLLFGGLGALILYGIGNLVFRYYSFYRKGYALREKDITYKSGVFWKRQTVVPLSRIQHCQIKEGPLDSLLELARLEIFTAGGSGSDLIIPGLRPEEATALRDLIISETAIVDDEEE